jgi:chromosome segregation ATPase
MSKATKPPGKNIHAACDQQISQLTQDVASRDARIVELEAEVKKVKRSAMAMAADYKERFDKQQKSVEELLARRESAVKFFNEVRTSYEKRIGAMNTRFAAMNEEHGAEFKKLRTESSDLRAQLRVLTSANAKLRDRVGALEITQGMPVQEAPDEVQEPTDAGQP